MTDSERNTNNLPVGFNKDHPFEFKLRVLLILELFFIIKTIIDKGSFIFILENESK